MRQRYGVTQPVSGTYWYVTNVHGLPLRVRSGHTLVEATFTTKEQAVWTAELMHVAYAEGFAEAQRAVRQTLGLPEDQDET